MSSRALEEGNYRYKKTHHADKMPAGRRKKDGSGTGTILLSKNPSIKMN
jgi:hypothetical protein